MSYLSLPFVALVLGCLSVCAVVPSRRVQNATLLGASLVFYTWIHPWFALPLLFSSLTDYAVALGMEARPDRRRALLGVSIVVNVALLSFFKYQGFFVENVSAVLGAAGLEAPVSTLTLLVPAGISFYTFQTLGYTYDVYRGDTHARRDPLDYLLFVLFFPQLVAGPIEAASRFLPQVERPRTLHPALVTSGLSLAMWGAVKKVVFADRLALDVDTLFSLSEPAWPVVMVASVGFGLQLYADFSGYTDIARGTARMLGFELSRNFDFPFVAVTTPSFWRRWHITLGEWVGKVLYVPIATGGRRGPGRVAAALLLSFLVVGIWHGASWTFVWLGVLQGVAAVVYTFGWPLIPAPIRRSAPFLVVAWLVHVMFVLIPSGVLFREVSMARVLGHLGRFGQPVDDLALTVASSSFGGFALAAVGLGLGSGVAAWLAPPRAARPWSLPLHATWWTLALALLLAMRQPLTRSFVYFAF